MRAKTNMPTAAGSPGCGRLRVGGVVSTTLIGGSAVVTLDGPSVDEGIGP
ncbi:MAG: hypothetical protein ACJAY5_000518 [Actinomycetes bacterium]|jgi:hypothetical protein